MSSHKSSSKGKASSSSKTSSRGLLTPEQKAAMEEGKKELLRQDQRKTRSVRMERRLDRALERLADLWGIDVNSAISVAVAEACRERGLLVER